MNGSAIKTVTGSVTSIGLSAYGPNSGEVTIAITTGAGESMDVFVGILGEPPDPMGIEAGPYASYVNMALTALTAGRQLTVTYHEDDKPRVNGMSLLA